MGRRFDAVIFDLSGVLVEPTWNLSVSSASGRLGHAQVVSRVLADYGHPQHPLCRWERGEIGLSEFRQELTVWPSAHDNDIDWLTFRLDIPPLSPFEPTIAAARALRRAGYRTAVLSNTMHEFSSVIAAQLPVDELFDAHVWSCDIGLRKPEPEVFTHTLRVLGDIEPSRALFLDDNPVCIEGAALVGLSTILVKDPYEAAREIGRTHLIVAPPS